MTAYTWDPTAAGAGIVLSNGDRTAGASTIAWKTVRATTSRSTGRWYAEMDLAAVQENHAIVGLATAAQPLDTYLGAGPQGWGVQVYSLTSATLRHNGGTAVAWGPPLTGVTCLAWDADAGLLWLGRLEGGVPVWYGDGDPAAGTGATWTGVTGTLYPAGSPYAPGGTLTVRLRGAELAGTPPAGFVAWAGPEIPPVVEAFFADPSDLESGQSATLSWSVTGTDTAASIGPTVGAVDLTGSATVTPGATTTYTLTATNPHGTTTATVTVTVTTAPPPPGAVFFSPAQRPRLTDPLPLRDAATLGLGAPSARLPWAWGRVTLAPVQADAEGRRWVVADHPCAGVDAVRDADGQPLLGWTWRNGQDATGRAVCWLELAVPRPGGSLAVDLRGALRPTTGALLQHPGDVLEDLLRRAGHPVTGIEGRTLRQQLPGLVVGGCVPGGSAAAPTAWAVLGDLLRSVGGAWAGGYPGRALVWPLLPVAGVPPEGEPRALLRIGPESRSLRCEADTDPATVVRVPWGYDWAEESPEAVEVAESQAAIQRYGRLEEEWAAPWLRRAADAAALAARVLAWRRWPRWRVADTLDWDPVRDGRPPQPGEWLAVQHPLCPLCVGGAGAGAGSAGAWPAPAPGVAWVRLEEVGIDPGGLRAEVKGKG